MDGLDIYIDDYGKPDPLPPDMLEKLAQWQFMRRPIAEETAEPDGIGVAKTEPEQGEVVAEANAALPDADAARVLNPEGGSPAGAQNESVHAIQAPSGQSAYDADPISGAVGKE